MRMRAADVWERAGFWRAWALAHAHTRAPLSRLSPLAPPTCSQPFGEVVDISMPADPATGTATGTAHLVFRNAADGTADLVGAFSSHIWQPVLRALRSRCGARVWWWCGVWGEVREYIQVVSSRATHYKYVQGTYLYR